MTSERTIEICADLAKLRAELLAVDHPAAKQAGNELAAVRERLWTLAMLLADTPTVPVVAEPSGE